MASSNRVRVNATALQGLAPAIRAAAAKAVREVAEDALTESNDRIPVEEGDLRRSGEVTAFPEELAAAITYDTPYAVRQHEDPTLNHPRQGEHHFLENAIEENADRYADHIAARIRKALS
jgi:hypothetical protein